MGKAIIAVSLDLKYASYFDHVSGIRLTVRNRRASITPFMDTTALEAEAKRPDSHITLVYEDNPTVPGKATKPKCKSFTKGGKACNAFANPGSDYCTMHSKKPILK